MSYCAFSNYFSNFTDVYTSPTMTPMISLHLLEAYER
jgi:hypothetical protein